MKGSNLALIENCAEGQSIAVGARVVGALNTLIKPSHFMFMTYTCTFQNNN